MNIHSRESLIKAIKKGQVDSYHCRVNCKVSGGYGDYMGHWGGEEICYAIISGTLKNGRKFSFEELVHSEKLEGDFPSANASALANQVLTEIKSQT